MMLIGWKCVRPITTGARFGRGSLNYDLIGNDQVEVHWKRKDEFVDASEKTNVAIAAFCTAYAWFELYKALLIGWETRYIMVYGQRFLHLLCPILFAK